jgi:hypothetical protein
MRVGKTANLLLLPDMVVMECKVKGKEEWRRE